MNAPLQFSKRLYRMLLAAFPRRFRDRFGSALAETFDGLANEAWQQRGLRGLTSLWCKTLGDLLHHAGGERLGTPLSLTNHPRRIAAGRRESFWSGRAQDLRFAMRGIRRAPAFAAAVIGTIALGIGANTAIFSVVNGIVLQPLPFPDSERVVGLCETHESIGDYCTVSPPNLQDWAAASETIEVFGLARNWIFVLERPEGGRSMRAGVATPGWFAAQALQPLLGRLFTPADMQEGDNHVVVLSHSSWQNDFGGDPDIVGTTLVLDGEVHSVIGVLPAGAWIHQFGFVDIWTPLTAIEDDVTNRDWRGFVGIGKLADGVSLTAARDEMEAIRVALEREYPDTNAAWGLQVEKLRDRVAGPIRSTLLLFLGAVGLVLLIACANVANLLLVRSTTRAQEFSVRASLGAGRGRLALQLGTESFMYAGIGGIGGVLLAVWAARIFLRLAPQDIPRLHEVHMDLRVLLFAAALTAVTAVTFGAAPALRVSRSRLAESLRAQGTMDQRGGSLRRGLVVVETALAVVLLVGAALLARSFSSMLDWDPGFDRNNLVSAFAVAPPATYATGDEAVALFERGAEALRALPQVAAVGLTSAGPLFGGTETAPFDVVGHPSASPDERPTTRYYDIGDEYFATLGVDIRRGRDFESGDRRESQPVVVVNETFARRFLPDADPLTSSLTLFDRDWRIIGVVADITPFAPDAPVDAEVYLPKRQYPRWGGYFVVRTRADATGFAGAARQALRSLDPDFGASGFSTLDEIAGRVLIGPRFNMSLLGIFAAVSMALAAIGTYGVIAFSVAQRAHEIGVRIALGAGPAAVRSAVLLSGLKTAFVGIVAGLAGATILSRLFDSLPVEIAGSDAVLLTIVGCGFALVAAIACWIPARRASRLDPLTALRG